MRHCYVLRVFTRDGRGGNHLGVVTDVTGLSDRAMQEIATENGYSETVFIDWREEGVPNVRIFTPGMELPFAGHPLVGAAWVLGMIGPATVDSMRVAVGEIPFRIDGDMVWVDTPMVTAVRAAPEAEAIAVAARLPEPAAAWWVDMPVTYLVVEVGLPDAVAAFDPDLHALQAQGAGMCYVTAATNYGFKSRFFAPDAAVDEDPATGSAAAALAAVRRFEGAPSGNAMIHQGAEIGWPSEIHVSWDDRYATLGGTVVRDEVKVLER